MSSQPGGAGGSSALGMPEVRWIPTTPQRPSGSGRAGVQATQSSEWVNVRVVVILTLACTALSLYDLFLLAGGG
jgi:hypothetical protein